MKLTALISMVHGSFVVGTGPDFATIDFPRLLLQGTDKFAGEGQGSFHQHPLQMSLKCRIADDASSLQCTSAYPNMPAATFVLKRN